MRDIATKTDGVSTLSASDFNANMGSELENICLGADFTLDPAGGPDTDLNMLGKAVAAHANAAATYQDSGAANAHVLDISTNLKKIGKYYDNLTVVFKAANTNTGASTVNINSIGVKDIKTPSGAALPAGIIESGEHIILRYDMADDRFEVIYSSGISTFSGILTDVINEKNATAGVTIDGLQIKDGGLVGQIKILQIVSEEIGRGTVTPSGFPNDDTIPQTTEGALAFTSASFTPKSASSKLLIFTNFTIGEVSDIGDAQQAGLFVNGTADALRVQSIFTATRQDQGKNGGPLTLAHVMPSWGLTGKTFTIRISDASTYNLQWGSNVGSATLLYGISSYAPFTIIEYE